MLGKRGACYTGAKGRQRVFKKFSYIKELRQIRGSPPLPRAASMRKCASFFHPIRWLPFRHDRTTDRRQSDRRQPSPADSPTRDRAPPARPARSRPGGDPGRHRSGLSGLCGAQAQGLRGSRLSLPGLRSSRRNQPGRPAGPDRPPERRSRHRRHPGPATPARPPGRLPAAGAYPPGQGRGRFPSLQHRPPGPAHAPCCAPAPRKAS